jgi:hypothetical protein
LRHNPLADGFPPEQMLLQDALESCGRKFTVPYAFGIDDEPRPTGADPEAPGLGSHGSEARFLDAMFHVIPHALTSPARAAVGTDAQK